MQLKKCNPLLSSMVIGVIISLACLLFVSPISIEAQVINSSAVTSSSDIEGQEQSSQGTQEENNKAIIIAFTNASNDRNYTAIEQYVAEDIIEHRPGVMSGRNSTIQFLQSLATAFPDFHTNIDHIVAEGDKVVVFTTTNGTHEGEFIFAPGVTPTGKQVSFKTADMYRISNGQMVEHWDVIEILDLMAQIGAITFSQPPVSTMPKLLRIQLQWLQHPTIPLVALSPIRKNKKCRRGQIFVKYKLNHCPTEGVPHMVRLLD